MVAGVSLGAEGRDRHHRKRGPEGAAGMGAFCRRYFVGVIWKLVQYYKTVEMYAQSSGKGLSYRNRLTQPCPFTE